MNSENTAFAIGGQLLTPAEAARITGLTEGTLANFRVNGRGPAFHKVARYVRYDSADLQNWMRSRRYRSTAEAR